MGGVLDALERAPHATALVLGDQPLDLATLCARAGAVARALGSQRGQRVGVLASRSLTAYAGTLGVFAAEGALVALNPDHPPARLASVLAQAGVETLLVEAASIPVLEALLPLAPGLRRILLPEGGGTDQRRPGIDVPGVDILDCAGEAPLPRPAPAPEDLAYLVFTSGSTGAPKGVAIAHGHLSVYMDNFLRHVGRPEAGMRVATTYELTFDIALHDMLVAWWHGAALHVVPPRQLVAPARFIRDQGIHWWFSVASAAMLMQRQGTLRPGVFPELRMVMLCGEPLPVGAAQAMAAAAPNAPLYNVYGPTETTMELSFYRFTADSPRQCRRGVVPIGLPFPGHVHKLVGEDGQEVAGPGQGELWLSGPQVGLGYWGLPERTAQSFLPGEPWPWYRTGDLVERDEEGMLHFVARVDHQIKLRGHRIELGEIEAALREAAGTDLVAVIPHPVEGGNAQGLVAFVERDEPLDEPALREALRGRLPAAMVPDRLVALPALPLNDNRKIDRGALAKRAAGE